MILCGAALAMLSTWWDASENAPANKWCQLSLVLHETLSEEDIGYLKRVISKSNGQNA